jgi:hypothetical protein
MLLLHGAAERLRIVQCVGESDGEQLPDAAGGHSQFLGPGVSPLVDTPDLPSNWGTFLEKVRVASQGFGDDDESYN